MLRRDLVCRIGALLAAAAFVAFWIIDPTFSEEPTVQRLIRSVISRLLGSLVFVFVLCYLQYRCFGRPRWSKLWVLIPAFAVAVNNLPILALINGTARVDRPQLLPLFIADVLMIGVFEELAFRGVLFPVLLEKRRSSTSEIFWTTLISSALFGLIHLANLAEGAGFGATLMQVGYSFLIGGMCAIVLLKTGNLFFCILLHAVYDFGGGLIRTVGSGRLWDTPTVILTAVLAVAVIAWMLWILFRVKPEETDSFFTPKK